jgi:hypothetical protein
VDRATACILLVTAAVLALVGCSDAHDSARAVRGPLAVDQATPVDLDGDEVLETVLIAGDEGSLIITDAEIVYRSRDRWRVVQAFLGDTNGDGRPEVVALLDADDGRHLGLFAYFAGEYRERLVTKEISPAPAALEVVDRAEVLGEGGPIAADSAGGFGDIVVLLQEPAPGESEGGRVLLRWNGFSFTRVEDAATP